MSNYKTTKILENICNLGCTRVNEIIEQLERGEKIDETGDLDKNEVDSLVQELKTIMSVYKKRS